MLSLRTITALAILCICTLAVVWGWQAVSFARTLAASSTNGSASDGLDAWTHTPGFATEALEESLRSGGATMKPAERYAKLEELIEVHPMSSAAWLSLAGVRQTLSHPPSDVNAAVAMSVVTGPNEGLLMWQRGLFGLIRWTMLSSLDRQQAATDLAGALAGNVITDQPRINLALSILHRQSAETQADILNALSVAGLSPAQFVRFRLKTDGG